MGSDGVGTASQDLRSSEARPGNAPTGAAAEGSQGERKANTAKETRDMTRS